MGQWRQLSQMTTEGVSSCTVYESTFYSSTRARIIDFMQAQYMYFKCHVAVPDQKVGINVPLSTHGCTPMSMTAHTGFKNTVNYCYLLS